MFIDFTVINGLNRIYKQHSSNIALYNYYDMDKAQNVGHLLTVSYTKVFSQTALRLTATGDHRMSPSDISNCSRW